MQPSPFTNRILQGLDAQCVQRLRLRRISLPAGRQIEVPGQPINNLFFLESGVALMTATFQDGSQVEVDLFGSESVLGISALMGARRSLNRIYMLLDGHGYAAPVAAARAEFLLSGDFQKLALSGVQAQLSQVVQSASCNAKHAVEQRLARWLLLCADRARTNSLAVSQEAIATMLGVRRMSAGFALRHLADLGLVEQHRGQLLLIDRFGIEQKACECYRAVKQRLDRVIKEDSAR